MPPVPSILTTITTFPAPIGKLPRYTTTYVDRNTNNLAESLLRRLPGASSSLRIMRNMADDQAIAYAILILGDGTLLIAHSCLIPVPLEPTI